MKNYTEIIIETEIIIDTEHGIFRFVADNIKTESTREVRREYDDPGSQKIKLTPGCMHTTIEVHNAEIVEMPSIETRPLPPAEMLSTEIDRVHLIHDQEISEQLAEKPVNEGTK